MPSHVRRRVGIGIVAILAATSGLLGAQAAGAAAISDAASAPAPAAKPASTGQADASSGRSTTGAAVTAQLSSHPRQYTDAELALLNQRMYDGDKVSKGHSAPAPHHAPYGPETPEPSQVRVNATMLRDSAIPTSAISGGTSFLSSTQEPSTDANGADIFQTGNWYASRSLDGGSTWAYLDPFSLFGTGFCCDQVTQYDPATGREFWLLQFSDHLVLANTTAAGAGAFTGWCYWNITPGWIGQPSTTGLDYNDLTITNSNINISTNFFPSAGGSGAALLRLPTAPMSTCSAFNYNYVSRTDNFTFKLVPGSTDTLYWGSNWGQTNGSSLRVFAWPESSTSYSWWDRSVAGYSFFTRNSGQNCASADGVVTNWCQYADSRILGAYRAAGILGFSFNAKQDSSHPFPYTRVAWFNEADKSYIGVGDQWASWGAIQFMTMAPNSQGLVGSEFAWGGGTGTTHYYPGTAANSSAANAINTSPNFYLWGSGNTCQYSGLWRWGDYLTVRTYKADPTKWIGAGYAMTGGNCGAAGAYPAPHNIQFSG